MAEEEVWIKDLETSMKGFHTDFQTPPSDRNRPSVSIPLILFENSKNPILIPPAIADLLRDKPPEFDYHDAELEEQMKNGEWSGGGGSSGDDTDSENMFSGVEVTNGSEGHHRRRASSQISGKRKRHGYKHRGGRKSSSEHEQYTESNPLLWPFELEFDTDELKKLMPFFACVLLNYVTSAYGEDEVYQHPILMIVTRGLPILALAQIVHGIRIVGPGPVVEGQKRYTRYIMVGLLFSCLGEVLLVWPFFFIPGVTAFGIAQVFYIQAFGWAPLNLTLGTGLYFISIGCMSTLVPTANRMEEEPLRDIGIFLYTILLTTMVWRGISIVRLFETEWSWRKVFPVVGGIAFGLTDLILTVHEFYMPIPYEKEIKMSIYYFAQLFITLSAIYPLDAYPSLASTDSEDIF